jgi:hypothetical protein
VHVLGCFCFPVLELLLVLELVAERIVNRLGLLQDLIYLLFDKLQLLLKGSDLARLVELLRLQPAGLE